jgi:hypothetical protein
MLRKIMIISWLMSSVCLPMEKAVVQRVLGKGSSLDQLIASKSQEDIIKVLDDLKEEFISDEGLVRLFYEFLFLDPLIDKTGLYYQKLKLLFKEFRPLIKQDALAPQEMQAMAQELKLLFKDVDGNGSLFKRLEAIYKGSMPIKEMLDALKSLPNYRQLKAEFFVEINEKFKKIGLDEIDFSLTESSESQRVQVVPIQEVPHFKRAKARVADLTRQLRTFASNIALSKIDSGYPLLAQWTSYAAQNSSLHEGHQDPFEVGSLEAAVQELVSSATAQPQAQPVQPQSQPVQVVPIQEVAHFQRAKARVADLTRQLRTFASNMALSTIDYRYPLLAQWTSYVAQNSSLHESHQDPFEVGSLEAAVHELISAATAQPQSQPVQVVPIQEVAHIKKAKTRMADLALQLRTFASNIALSTIDADYPLLAQWTSYPAQNSSLHEDHQDPLEVGSLEAAVQELVSAATAQSRTFDTVRGTLEKTQSSLSKADERATDLQAQILLLQEQLKSGEASTAQEAASKNERELFDQALIEFQKNMGGISLEADRRAERFATFLRRGHVKELSRLVELLFHLEQCEKEHAQLPAVVDHLHKTSAEFDAFAKEAVIQESDALRKLDEKHPALAWASEFLKEDSHHVNKQKVFELLRYIREAIVAKFGYQSAEHQALKTEIREIAAQLQKVGSQYEALRTKAYEEEREKRLNKWIEEAAQKEFERAKQDIERTRPRLDDILNIVHLEWPTEVCLTGLPANMDRLKQEIGETLATLSANEKLSHLLEMSAPESPTHAELCKKHGVTRTLVQRSGKLEQKLTLLREFLNKVHSASTFLKSTISWLYVGLTTELSDESRRNDLLKKSPLSAIGDICKVNHRKREMFLEELLKIARDCDHSVDSAVKFTQKYIDKYEQKLKKQTKTHSQPQDRPQEMEILGEDC